MHPLLLGIFGGFIAGAAITADFERAAAREIRGKLGQEAKVKVRTRASFGIVEGAFVAVRIEASGFTTDGLPLFTEPEKSKAGKIGRLELSLKDFTLRGLKVDKLEVNIPKCRYDRTLALTRKTFRLTESGEGLGSVEVSANALATFAMRKYKEIRNVTIKLRDDRCTVEGTVQILFVSAPFRAEGKLVSPDGSKLEIADATIAFNGQPASDTAREGILKALNPIVDLDKDLGLFGAMRVERIGLQNDVLRAEGPTHIPDLPKVDQ